MTHPHYSSWATSATTASAPPPGVADDEHVVEAIAAGGGGVRVGMHTHTHHAGSSSSSAALGTSTGATAGVGAVVANHHLPPSSGVSTVAVAATMAEQLVAQAHQQQAVVAAAHHHQQQQQQNASHYASNCVPAAAQGASGGVGPLHGVFGGTSCTGGGGTPTAATTTTTTTTTRDAHRNYHAQQATIPAAAEGQRPQGAERQNDDHSCHSQPQQPQCHSHAHAHAHPHPHAHDHSSPWLVQVPHHEQHQRRRHHQQQQTQQRQQDAGTVRGLDLLEAENENLRDRVRILEARLAEAEGRLGDERDRDGIGGGVAAGGVAKGGGAGGVGVGGRKRRRRPDGGGGRCEVCGAAGDLMDPGGGGGGGGGPVDADAGNGAAYAGQFPGAGWDESDTATEKSPSAVAAMTTKRRRSSPSNDEQRVGVIVDGRKHRHDAAFEKNLQLLRDFKKNHGHCNATQSHGKVGEFVMKQRAQYKRFQQGQQCPLDADRIKILEDMGMKWSSDRLSQWNKCHERLKIFKNKYGHCCVRAVSNCLRDDPKLAAYASQQRLELGFVKKWEREHGRRMTEADRRNDKGIKAARISMTEERRALIEDLGCHWLNNDESEQDDEDSDSLKREDESADDRTNAKQARADGNNDNSDAPTMGSEGPSLSSSTTIGLRTTKPRMTRAEQAGENTVTWYKFFEELRLYKRAKGDCLVPTLHAKSGLGAWVRRQRWLYKHLRGDVNETAEKFKKPSRNPLSENRIRLLLDLGFAFDPPVEEITSDCHNRNSNSNKKKGRGGEVESSLNVVFGNLTPSQLQQQNELARKQIAARNDLQREQSEEIARLRAEMQNVNAASDEVPDQKTIKRQSEQLKALRDQHAKAREAQTSRFRERMKKLQQNFQKFERKHKKLAARQKAARDKLKKAQRTQLAKVRAELQKEKAAALASGESPTEEIYRLQRHSERLEMIGEQHAKEQQEQNNCFLEESEQLVQDANADSNEGESMVSEF